MKTPIFLKRLKYRSARNKLIPDIKTSNPIINDLVDLVIKYKFDYDTVYSVYTEWDNNLEATESVFVTAFFMCVDPLEITQESMRLFGEILSKSMIAIGEVENNPLKN